MTGNPGCSGSDEDSRKQSVQRIAGVLRGEGRLAWRLPEGGWTSDASPAPAGILSGAFNPLHAGHAELRRVAEQVLEGPVGYELPLRNADKPPIPVDTAVQRVEQPFDAPLAVTTAATFLEKARILPGTVFVVGIDTAIRVVDPRFYPEPGDGVQAILSELRGLACRFLVAARLHEGTLLRAADLEVSAEFADLFQALPEADFRNDLSSSQLRQRGESP